MVNKKKKTLVTFKNIKTILIETYNFKQEFKYC